MGSGVFGSGARGFDAIMAQDLAPCFLSRGDTAYLYNNWRYPDILPTSGIVVKTS